MGHGGLPRRGEGRVDVVHLDHDLHPHAAGADEVGGTEMVPRGQRAAALESDAQPPALTGTYPLGIVAQSRLQAQGSTLEGQRPLNVVHEELEPVRRPEPPRSFRHL